MTVFPQVQFSFNAAFAYNYFFKGLANSFPLFSLFRPSLLVYIIYNNHIYVPMILLIRFEYTWLLGNEAKKVGSTLPNPYLLAE